MLNKWESCLFQLEEKDQDYVTLKAHCHNLEIRLKDLEHLKVCFCIHDSKILNVIDK